MTRKKCCRVNRWRGIGRLLLGISLSLLTTSCWTQPAGVEDQNQGETLKLPPLQADRMIIENDEEFLDSRVTRLDRNLPIVPEVGGPPNIHREGSAQGTLGSSAVSRPRKVELRLVAEIPSPVYGGVVLQANDVEIQGGRAVVAYNVAGETSYGAVQVLDVSRPHRPELMSEVIFLYADVHTVAIQGTKIYAGLASLDPALTSAAMVEELDLNGRNIERTNRYADLPSVSATDIAVTNGLLSIGVGAEGGGVALLDQANLELQHFNPLHDVRGLALGSSSLFAASGQPGFLHTLDPDAFVIVGTQPIRGFGQIDAKGTIEAYQKFCFLGAGDGGFLVQEDGVARPVARLENPAVPGLSELEVTCNAASIENDLAFLANGGAGLRVVDLGVPARLALRADDFDLRVLGEIDFGEEVSVNMVKARGEMLIVASGLGGIKLVEMSFLDGGGSERLD